MIVRIEAVGAPDKRRPRQSRTDARPIGVVYYVEPARLGQIAAWRAGTEVGRAVSASPVFVSDTADRSA